MLTFPLWVQDVDRGPLVLLLRSGYDPLDELESAGVGVAKNGPPDLSGEGFRWPDAQQCAREMFHKERRHFRRRPGDW